MGVLRDRIKKLFGDHGLRELYYFIQIEVVERREDRYYSKAKNFTGSFENIVEHFRACADFIKPHKLVERLPLNPLFVKASESVSIETYKGIARVQ